MPDSSPCPFFSFDAVPPPSWIQSVLGFVSAALTWLGANQAAEVSPPIEVRKLWLGPQGVHGWHLVCAPSV